MEIKKADITKLEVDAIVNAANGIGIMGAGVAGAISRAGGPSITTEAVAICLKYRFDAGSAYYTKAGKLPCKYVIHAVTMKLPGQRTPLGTVEKCLYAAFERASKLGVKTMAIPGLGTKIGKAPLSEVAEVYKRVVPELEKKYGIAGIVCDVMEEFIEELIK